MRVGSFGAVMRWTFLAATLAVGAGANSLLSAGAEPVDSTTERRNELPNLADFLKEKELRKAADVKTKKDEIVAKLIQPTVDGPPHLDDVQRLQKCYDRLPLESLILSLKYHHTGVFVLTGGEKMSGPKISLAEKKYKADYITPRQSLLASGIIKSVDPKIFSTPDLQQTSDKVLAVADKMDDLYNDWINDAEKRFNALPKDDPKRGPIANEIYSLQLKKHKDLEDLTLYSGSGRIYLLSLASNLESPLDSSSCLVDVAHRHGAKKREDVEKFLEILALLNPTTRGKNISDLEVMQLGKIGKNVVIPRLYCRVEPTTGKTFWMNQGTYNAVKDWDHDSTLGLYIAQARSIIYLRKVLQEEAGKDWTAMHEKGHEIEDILRTHDREYYIQFKPKLDAAHLRHIASGEFISDYEKIAKSPAETYAEMFAALHSDGEARNKLETMDQGRSFALVQASIDRLPIILQRLEGELKKQESKADFHRPIMPSFPNFSLNISYN